MTISTSRGTSTPTSKAHPVTHDSKQDEKGVIIRYISSINSGEDTFIAEARLPFNNLSDFPDYLEDNEQPLKKIAVRQLDEHIWSRHRSFDDYACSYFVASSVTRADKINPSGRFFDDLWRQKFPDFITQCRQSQDSIINCYIDLVEASKSSCPSAHMSKAAKKTLKAREQLQTRKQNEAFREKHTLPYETFWEKFMTLANGHQTGKIIHRDVPVNTIINEDDEDKLVKSAEQAGGSQINNAKKFPIFSAFAHYIQDNLLTGRAEARFGEIRFAVRNGFMIHMNRPKNIGYRIVHGKYLLL